jgi:hypothetical protein
MTAAPIGTPATNSTERIFAMKGYIDAMKELRNALRHASPLQLAIALEAIAYCHAETYLELNPPPEASEEELAELHAALVYSCIAGALNTAAEVALDLRATPQQQPSADDEACAMAAAESAIAKAQGRLQ